MKRWLSVPILIIVFVLAGLPQIKAQSLFRDRNAPLQARVSDLLKALTLEEKAQMLGNNSPAVDRLNIPAYNWWNESLHGLARAGEATVFPQAIAMAATF